MHATRSSRSLRPAFAALALVPLVLAFTLFGATNAIAITRATVVSRARVWLSHPVPYSQAKSHLGYRTDCSGYVSACWATGISWSTATFSAVSHRITVGQLKPGDALLAKGHHIRLFYGWTDSSHRRYVAYEAGSIVAVARVHSLASDLAAGYVPTRYNYISDGSLPNNVLLNDSFDGWATSWGHETGQADSWQASGVQWETLVVHRTDVYHTPDSSLQLLNSSDDPDDITTLAQAAPVVAGATYRLSAWARTDSDPASVRLSVSYLNVAGQSVAETSTTGDRWGVGAVAFGQMSAMTTAPADAVTAFVTVRLAGGTTAETTGTSVILDDISLARPQAAVRIKTSATTVRSGKKVVLSGSVSPNGLVGANATIFVLQPGSKTWKRLAGSAIYSTGPGAAYRGTFAFRRNMRKGVYQFRTSVPGRLEFVGSTSNTVSVKFK